MTSTQDRWIELNDFTPGIHSDFHAGGSGGARAAILKNGAATVENTYRCVGDPDGGLVPFPRATAATATIAPLGFTFHPTWLGMYLLDAVMVPWGNVLEGGTASFSAQQLMRVFTLWGMIASTTGADPYYKMVLCRMYDYFTTGTKDVLWESSNNAATYLGANTLVTMQGGNMISLLTSGSAHSAPVTQSDLITAVGGCVHMPVDHAVAAIVAPEAGQTTFDTDVSVNYPTGVAAGTEYAAGFPWIYPNPTTLNTVYIPQSDIAAIIAGYRYAINHQGRFVSLAYASRSSGSAIGSSIVDVIYYNPPLDAQGLIFTTGLGSFAPADDNITGPISFGVSASVDELLLVRESGGGVLLRGDLDNPTVQKLPGIESTQGVTCVPVTTPIGIVYGTRLGVYAWSGGDTARKLSEQLDGMFWDHSGGKPYSGNRGRFGYWNPFVFTPNNWCMDTRTNAWWRSENTATRVYNVYLSNPTTGELFAFPWVNTASAPMYYTYAAATLAQSWSWQSQPLVESRDRVLAVRELELVVSPGTNVNTDQSIAVTVTGYDDTGAPTTATKTFTFSGVNGAQPIILRGDLSAELQGRYIQVRFVADGGSTGGGNGNAPKLLSARFATRDGSQPRKV